MKKALFFLAMILFVATTSCEKLAPASESTVTADTVVSDTVFVVDTVAAVDTTNNK